MTYDPLDRDADPFKPPAVPVEVFCLHCGKEYESYQIEWRVETNADGKEHGFWCCPMPGCDGRGFGFDILPTDPEYRDERGGWVSDDEEDDEWDEDDFDDEDWDDDLDGPDDGPADRYPGDTPSHGNGQGTPRRESPGDDEIPF